MSVALRESVDRLSDPCNLDATVEEVFGVVLGCQCRQIDNATIGESQSVMAVIGFGGILSGACVLHCGAKAAQEMAGHMTGITFAALDATVQDAIGEICNMVAGGWKGRIPELSAGCGMSVPAVITGCDYKVRVHTPQFQIQRWYAFDDVEFTVTIVCEGLQ